LTLKGAMCLVFRRNVIWFHLYDTKGWERAGSPYVTSV